MHTPPRQVAHAYLLRAVRPFEHRAAYEKFEHRLAVVRQWNMFLLFFMLPTVDPAFQVFAGGARCPLVSPLVCRI